MTGGRLNIKGTNSSKSYFYGKAHTAEQRRSLQQPLILLTLYMLAPKIDLIHVGLGALRAEDIVWLLAVLINYRQLLRPPPMPKFIVIYGIYIALSVVSGVVNISDTGPSSFLFVFRQIQYITWGIIFAAHAHRIARPAFTSALQIISIVLVLWGAGEAFGVIPKIGKFAGSQARLTINTSGPFETSVVLAILLFAVRPVLVRCSLFVLLLMTQARITAAGVVAAVLASKPKVGLVLLLAAGIIFATSSQLKAALGETRFAETPGPAQMLGVFERMWREVEPVSTHQEYIEEAGYDLENPRYPLYFDKNIDPSFQVRAQRWAIILKSMALRPVHLLIGSAPGAFGVATDSNIIRVVGETGLAGLILYALTAATIFRTFLASSLTVISLIILLVSSIFIDIFWSTKAMPLFWAIAAWEYRRGASLCSLGFDRQILRRDERHESNGRRWRSFIGGSSNKLSTRPGSASFVSHQV